MEINFGKKAPEETLKELIADYEQVMNEPLGLSDPMRLFLNCQAVWFTQLRFLIDFTGKQNLLTYAEGEYLNAQGDLRGVPRLTALPAKTTLKFTLKENQINQVIIPSETKVSSSDGFVFITTETGKINAGDMECEVLGIAAISGKIGNAYDIGSVVNIADNLTFPVSVTNTDKVSGGADYENDEHYRERIILSMERFSTAGAVEAYRYHTLSSNPAIEDVSVISPAPGQVNLYILMEGARQPTNQEINRTYNHVNDEKVRPLTDNVTVMGPIPEMFHIGLTYYISRTDLTKEQTIINRVNNAINNYITWQCEKIDRDINPSKLVADIISAGAKRVELESPVFKTLNGGYLATLSNTNILYGGIEHD